MSLLYSNSVKLKLYVELRYMKSDRITQKISKDCVNLWEPWNCEQEPTKAVANPMRSNQIKFPVVTSKLLIKFLTWVDAPVTEDAGYAMVN